MKKKAARKPSPKKTPSPSSAARTPPKGKPRRRPAIMRHSKEV